MIMTKTAKQVQTDVIALLKDSELATLVTGEIYRNGYRPRDSRQEDIIVTHTAGLADEIQTGVVNVCIYIPDIDPYGNGVLVEDGNRTSTIEVTAQSWVETLSRSRSNYLFELQQTIRTENEPETNQHFVVVKLKYRLYE